MSDRPHTRVVRVSLSARSVVLLVGGLVVALVASNIFEQAREALALFLASTIVAVLLAPLVDRLDRRVPRGLAVVAVLLPLVSIAAGVAVGVFRDLDNQIAKLQQAIPEAAGRIEQDERFGEVATDLRLQERASDAVEGLEERLSGRARKTARSVTNYLAGGVLMLFMLAWAPRLTAAGLAQLRDEGRRARLGSVIEGALRVARGYLFAAIVQAGVFGVAAYGLCRVAGVPAAMALALWAALWCTLPYLGLLVGSLPAVLLAAGLESFTRAGWLLAGFVALQVAQGVVQTRVHRRTLYVGPGAVLFSALIGFAIYNTGGALYGVAVMVLVLAVVDTAATDDPAPEQVDALAV